MPNILLNFYNERIAEPRAQMLKDAPNHLDPTVSDRKIHEAVSEMLDLQERETLFLTNLCTVAAKENDEKLRQVYRSLKPLPPAPGAAPPQDGDKKALDDYNKAKRRYDSQLSAETEFIKKVRNGNPLAFSTIYGTDKTGEYVQLPVGTVVEAFDKVLSDEASKSVVDLPIILKNSLSSLPKETTHRPRQGEIDELIAKHTHTGDPVQNAKNRELLDRAGQILENIKPEVLYALNYNYSTSPPGSHSVDAILEGRSGTLIHHGLELLDGNESFKDLVKPADKTSSGAPLNTMSDSFTKELSEQELNYLHGQDLGLSEETRNVMRSIMKQMDDLKYRDYGSSLLNRSKFPLSQPTEIGERYIFTEHAQKYYAFVPVVRTKQAVAAAVRSGDMKALADAVKKYDRIEKLTDDMMETLRSDRVSHEPVFSSNLDSTRENTLLIPAKYVTQLSNHIKLNSLFVLHANLINAKLSLDDLMKDPMGVCEKLGEQYLKAGLDGRPENVGAGLENGLKRVSLQQDLTPMSTEWSKLHIGFFRGVMGLAGMEKDPVRRDKFLAAAHLGFMRAAERIRAEDKLLQTQNQVMASQTGAAKAMRGVIYQTAALAPETGEKRFNLRKLMEDFSQPVPTRPGEGEPQPDEPQNIENEKYPAPPDPDAYPSNAQMQNPDRNHKYSWWNGHTAVQEMIRNPGSVDFQELAGRNARVVAEANREKQLSGSFDSRFQPDLYLLHAWSAQDRLLRNASAADQLKPGFGDFQDSLKNTWKLAKDPDVKIALYAAANYDELDLLKQGRTKQATLRDSTEYSDMKRSLNSLLEAGRHLRTGNAEKIELLSRTNYIERLEDAKRDAFRYVRLKLKNGTKTYDDFVYDSGVARAQEGLELWRKLGKMEDDLGLRSPAQKLLDESREALLMNRAKPAWVEKQEGLKTLAKLIYADSLVQAGLSREEQEQYLTEDKLEEYTQRICSDLQSVRKLWDKKGPVTHALRQDESFRQFADRWAKPLKAEYDKTFGDARLQKAREDFCKGFAMDRVAENLEIPDHCRTADNELLQQMSEDLMKQPEFKEVMDRLMAGRSAEELRKLHAPAAPATGANVDTSKTIYHHARDTLVYEKRCAVLAAEASLRGKKADQKQIDQLAAALRNKPSFQIYIQSKVENLSPREVAELINGLVSPETRSQVLTEIASNVKEHDAQPGLQARQPIKIRIQEKDPFKALERAPKAQNQPQAPKQGQGSGAASNEFKQQLEEKFKGIHT